MVGRGAAKYRSGWWRHRRPREKGAAGALIASVGSATTRAQIAHLQRRLIEQNIGIVGHSVFSRHHTEYLSCLPQASLSQIGRASCREREYNIMFEPVL